MDRRRGDLLRPARSLVTTACRPRKITSGPEGSDSRGRTSAPAASADTHSAHPLRQCLTGPPTVLAAADLRAPRRTGASPAGSGWAGRVSSVSPAREVRLGHALQARTVQLPGGGERHVVEDDYFLGRLVADPRAGELDQFLAGRPLGPLGQGDVGADVLAVDKVVAPDHSGVRH